MYIKIVIITMCMWANLEALNIFNKQKMCEFLQQFIKPGDMVFDVGANIGNKTDTYLACKAHVVCFEPQPECVAHLESRFKDKKNIVTIENIGLAASDGVLELMLCLQASTIATFSQEYLKNSRFAEHGYTWDRKIKVPVTTLDAMIAKYGKPRFCKIDVENFEFEVIKGLTQPIDVISFELNCEYMDATRQCVDYLNNLGYKKFNFVVAEQSSFVFEAWLDAYMFLDRLYKLKTTDDWSEIWGLWGDVYASYV